MLKLVVLQSMVTYRMWCTATECVCRSRVARQQVTGMVAKEE